MAAINIPNGWRPRPYQMPLWNYLEGGGKRAVAIHHRRAGKDDVALNWAAVACMQGQPIECWHMLPEQAQARKAIWDSVSPHTGKRRIDQAFPPEIVASSNATEMKRTFVNGSLWRVVGSDNYNSLVGSSPKLIVFSEYALANPQAWAFFRPILAENGGTAIFITTPRGNNHAKRLYDMAISEPGWFGERLSARQSGAISADILDSELRQYISEYGEEQGRAFFEQEYECSFAAALLGAYYGGLVNRAEREGRIIDFEIDPSLPVHTAWDLGKGARNPIWCFQVVGSQPRIVDFYRPETDDLEDWVKWLKDKGYHGIDYVPHDIMVAEWGTKRTRFETLQALGRKPRRVANVSVEDGRTAARATINQALFHAKNCELGIDGLRNYRREWDDELKRFRDQPVKDWADHIADSFRYLALAWRDASPVMEPPKKPSELILKVSPTGVMQSNMSVREAVEAMARRKKMQE